MEVKGAYTTIKDLYILQNSNPEELYVIDKLIDKEKKYLKVYRKAYPFFGLLGKPKTYQRFFINAKAILGFDAYEELGKIQCPTYIISGSDDKTVGNDAAHELKANILGSKLHIYEGLGHAAYEEAKDFYDRVYGFLMGDESK